MSEHPLVTFNAKAPKSPKMELAPKAVKAQAKAKATARKPRAHIPKAPAPAPIPPPAGRPSENTAPAAAEVAAAAPPLPPPPPAGAGAAYAHGSPLRLDGSARHVRHARVHGPPALPLPPALEGHDLHDPKSYKALDPHWTGLILVSTAAKKRHRVLAPRPDVVPRALLRGGERVLHLCVCASLALTQR